MGSRLGLAFRDVARSLAACRVRDQEDGADAESGFTLIELMVVLLIMGILLAIAIPTFLGVTAGANDRAAQSNLTNAMTSAKAIYVQGSTYGTGTTTTVVSKLTTQEPELTFVTGATASTTQNLISVEVAPTGTGLRMAVWSKSTKTCWFGQDVETSDPATAGVMYNNADTTKPATCKATPGPTTGWLRSYPVPATGH